MGGEAVGNILARSIGKPIEGQKHPTVISGIGDWAHFGALSW
jgi:hypothetical protein